MKRLQLYAGVLAVGWAGCVVLPLVAAADDAAVPAGAAPPLAYGVSEIIQLSQAQVGDPTIVTFIKNSGNSYGLDAAQVIYLQQQGVSTSVINAMLSQPAPGSQSPVMEPAPAVPVTQVVMVQDAPPAVVVPTSSVYVIPDSQTYRYYNSYRPAAGYITYAPISGCFVPRNCRGGGYHGSWHH
jgi:hypothetical protein